MKKILVFIAFVGVLVWLHFSMKSPIEKPIYVSTPDQILPDDIEKPASEDEIAVAIKEINEKARGIRTFASPNVRIELTQNIKFHLSGRLAVEKDGRFRLLVDSRLGKEMDAGLNDTHFWFWSKRLDPPALYHARLENVNKSDLKTVFNPAWMLESLSITGVDTTNAKLGKFKQFYSVVQDRLSSNGEKVKVMTLIDPSRKVISGHYLYDGMNRLLVSAEVKRFQTIDGHTVPADMVLIWREENIVIEWTINNPSVNLPVHPNNWVMPTMRNSIEMGR